MSSTLLFGVDRFKRWEVRCSHHHYLLHILRLFIPILSSSASWHTQMLSDASAATVPDWSTPSISTPSRCDGDRFNDQMQAAMQRLVKEWGGPAQYLQAHLNGIPAKNEFARWLFKTFPLADDTLFQNHMNIDAVDDETRTSKAALCYHVAALGYDEKCSIRPPPEAVTCLLLADQYLVDGFITSSDPLLILPKPELGVDTDLVRLWVPPAGESVLGVQTVGYLKGMARTTTLLSMLHLVMIDDLPLATLNPKLFSSVLRIRAHFMPQRSRVDEALKNMKISTRGSIRKGPNLFTIVGIINNLSTVGYTDYPAFMKSWNAQSGKSFEVKGQKAVSLKLILEMMPTSVLEMIMRHISKLGFVNSCISDDNMSSKKTYPGYQFRGSGGRVRYQSNNRNVFIYMCIYTNICIYMHIYMHIHICIYIDT